MLRSTDGRQIQSENRSVRTSLPIVVMMLLGIVVVAMRGFAVADEIAKEAGNKPAVEQSGTPVRPVAKTEILNTTVPRNATEAQCFHRPVIHASVLGENETGMLMLRVRDLLQQSAMKDLGAFLNHQIRTHAANLSTNIDPNTLDVAAIDWGASRTMVSIERNIESPDSGENSLQLQNKGLLIHLHDPIDFAAWMRRNLPKAAAYVVADSTVFELPWVPPFFLSVRMAQIGPPDVRVGFSPGNSFDDITSLEEVFGRISAKSESSAKWDRQWSEVSGGIAAFAVTDVHVNSAIENTETSATRFDKMARQLIASLLQRATNFCYGFDFAQDGSLVVRLRMTHGSVSKAKSSADGFAAIRKVFEEDGVPEDTSPEDLIWLEVIRDLLQSASLAVSPEENGTVDLVVEGCLSQGVTDQLISQLSGQN